MDEEILVALTKANAVDQESGLTIEKLMELTGRNVDTVVGSTKRLRQDRKTEVSNPSALTSRVDHAWPTVTGKDVTGEDVAKARNELKVQTCYPVVVWLGPVLRQEIEERRKKDEERELLRALISRPAVAVHGDNSGQIAVGDGNKQEQQSGVQSFQDLSLNDQSTQTAIAQATINHHPASLSSGQDIRNAVIGGVILLVIGWLVKWYWTGDPF